MQKILEFKDSSIFICKICKKMSENFLCIENTTKEYFSTTATVD
jgi:hypothetical protein